MKYGIFGAPEFGLAQKDFEVMLEMDQLPEAWNRRHARIFQIRQTDNVNHIMIKVLKAWKDR